MTKEERTLVIIDRLKKEYPEATALFERIKTCQNAQELREKLTEFG